MTYFTFSPTVDSINHYHTLTLDTVSGKDGIVRCSIDTVNNTTITSTEILIRARNKTLSASSTKTIGPSLHAILSQMQLQHQPVLPFGQKSSCAVCSLSRGTHDLTIRTLDERFFPDQTARLTTLTVPCPEHPVGHRVILQEGSFWVNDHIPIRASKLTHSTAEHECPSNRNILFLSLPAQETYNGSGMLPQKTLSGLEMLKQLVDSGHCIERSLFDESARVVYDLCGQVKVAKARDVQGALQTVFDLAKRTFGCEHVDGSTCQPIWQTDYETLKQASVGSVNVWVSGSASEMYPSVALDQAE